MTSDKTLYHLKQTNFYIHRDNEPSVVIKYTTKYNDNKIEHINVFINNECLEMMSVLNFANIIHALLVKGINESDIPKLFKQLSVDKNWSMVKQKTLNNVGYNKLISTPYIYFQPFNIKLKQELFNEIYEKYNIKIGGYTNE